MPNITAKLLAATVSCALLNVFPAAAQQQGPARIRGTIESVDGNNLTVAVRDGTIAEDWPGQRRGRHRSRQDHARRREARLLHRLHRNAPGRWQPEGDRDPYFS